MTEKTIKIHFIGETILTANRFNLWQWKYTTFSITAMIYRQTTTSGKPRESNERKHIISQRFLFHYPLIKFSL